MSELPEWHYHEIPEWTHHFQWLAVVGARVFANPGFRTIAKDIVLGTLDRIDLPDREVGITSGGAAGIDTVGAELADELWLRKCIFLPKNKRWEPRGYKERNETIGNLCNWMVGIRCETTLSWGTGQACEHAESQGKLVERYLIHRNPGCRGCLTDASWKVDCEA